MIHRRGLFIRGNAPLDDPAGSLTQAEKRRLEAILFGRKEQAFLNTLVIKNQRNPGEGGVKEVHRYLC